MDIPTKEQAHHHLNRLRQARAAAMADAEGFAQILFAIEELGALMTGRVFALGSYRDSLRKLAARSALSWDESTTPNTKRFEWLFSIVKDVRNEAMHQGASARHATDRCVDLCLILEDALATMNRTVGHLMVTGVVEAKPHETISAIRRMMLSQSFSFLPVKVGERWSLVPDLEVARFLQHEDDACPRATRLAMSLSSVIGQPSADATGNQFRRSIQLVDAGAYVTEQQDVSALLSRSFQRPVLVTHDGSPRGHLLGILTSFDLL